MKAILVIDMPDICYMCPCYDHEGGICQASDSWKTDVLHGCPLKPMPQKKSHIEGSWNAEKIETTNNFENGWNACLEEITGETE